MAYIDIETENADFRLALVNHDFVITDNDLPENCSGLLVEMLYESPQVALDSLNGSLIPSSFEGIDKYGAIREYAKQREIPLVTLEPAADILLVQCEREDRRERRQRLTGKEWEDFTVLEIINIGFSGMELVQPFIGIVEQFDPLVNGTDFMVSTRNLVAAERAASFAKFQENQMKKRPYLAVVMGLGHLGIRNMFKMDPDERMTRIAEDPNVYDFFYPETFDQLFVTEFKKKPQAGHWHNYAVEFPHLKQ